MVPVQAVSRLSEPSEAQLIQLCRRILPGLNVEKGSLGSELMVFNRGNSHEIGRLIEALQQQYPEAGRHYWSARAWNLMIWQPVLLALLATELLQQTLNLAQVGQHRSGTLVAGMTLGNGAIDGRAACRRQAMAHLREACESLLAELGQQIRVNPALLRRLLADRILATLLRMRSSLMQCDNTDIRLLAEHWLDGTGLQGASTLMMFSLPHGGQELALDRKACCQHYRRQDGELCKTCPRQPMALRIKRLQEEWSPDAGAE